MKQAPSVSYGLNDQLNSLVKDDPAAAALRLAANQARADLQTADHVRARAWLLVAGESDTLGFVHRGDDPYDGTRLIAGWAEPIMRAHAGLTLVCLLPLRSPDGQHHVGLRAEAFGSDSRGWVAPIVAGRVGDFAPMGGMIPARMAEPLWQ